MLDQRLLEVLRCPACRSEVTPLADKWLVCQNPECKRKYPVRDNLPIMLIEEGDKYVDVPEQELETMEP